MKSQVEYMLISIYVRIGIDRPHNHDYILDFIINDVTETRTMGVMTPFNFTSEDVNMAFRRFLESNYNGEY